MKRTILHNLFIIVFFVAFTSNAQVGINTTTPNAQLEIKSSNQVTPLNTDGLIIPKVDAFPATNPTAAQQGMMVYLTTTSGLNAPGFYYWDNNALPIPKWVAISSGGASSSFNHYIGELYGGGIVVFVWKESGVEKGLIASLIDMKTSTNSNNISWTTVALAGTLVPLGAKSLVDGKSNTAAIIAQNGSAADTAATICDAYTNGGYSDWYFPSIWELDQIYSAAFIVNTILGSTDGIKTNTYWSSTEINNSFAYIKYLDLGYTNNITKGNLLLVRAVRRF